MTTFSLLSGMLDRNSTDNPAIIEERCLRRRLNTNECQLCMTACPHGALTLRGRAVHLDPGLCTGCHRCRAVCPQDACTSDFDLRQTMEEAMELDVPLVVNMETGDNLAK